jgi:hypothetical protein
VAYARSRPSQQVGVFEFRARSRRKATTRAASIPAHRHGCCAGVVRIAYRDTLPGDPRYVLDRTDGHALTFQHGPLLVCSSM